MQIPAEFRRADCPVCFAEDGLALRFDKKGRPYFRCESCSRKFWVYDAHGIAGMLTAGAVLRQAGLSALREHVQKLVAQMRQHEAATAAREKVDAQAESRTI